METRTLIISQTVMQTNVLVTTQLYVVIKRYQLSRLVCEG